MRGPIKSAAICAAVLALMVSGSAWATVLIFERDPVFPSNACFTDIAYDSQGGYGDRVDATFQTYFNHADPNYWVTYYYGSGGGATPNVVLNYPSLQGPSTPRYYLTGYTGLTGVAYVHGNCLIDLVADAGYQVTLQSFDMSTWLNGTAVVTTFRILDGNGTVLWDNSGAEITGLQHYAPNVTAATLRLEIDEPGILESFAVDNIQFAQGIAGPSNGAPVVQAGSDFAVMLPYAAHLAGTITDDGLPNPPAACTAAWSMVSGPGTANFANPAAAATDASFSSAGTYVLQLAGGDTDLSTSSTVTVRVLRAGDFTGDGRVDGLDFLNWQSHYPNFIGGATADGGDANADGKVDGLDFLVWQSNYQQ